MIESDEEDEVNIKYYLPLAGTLAFVTGIIAGIVVLFSGGSCRESSGRASVDLATFIIVI